LPRRFVPRNGIHFPISDDVPIRCYDPNLADATGTGCAYLESNTEDDRTWDDHNLCHRNSKRPSLQASSEENHCNNAMKTTAVASPQFNLQIDIRVVSDTITKQGQQSIIHNK
jgi:hypothetical protein